MWGICEWAYIPMIGDDWLLSSKASLATHSRSPSSSSMPRLLAYLMDEAAIGICFRKDWDVVGQVPKKFLGRSGIAWDFQNSILVSVANLPCRLQHQSISGSGATDLSAFHTATLDTSMSNTTFLKSSETTLLLHRIDALYIMVCPTQHPKQQREQHPVTQHPTLHCTQNTTLNSNRPPKTTTATTTTSGPQAAPSQQHQCIASSSLIRSNM